MKKFFSGLLIGLVLATGVTAFASGQAIKLIVNGNEVFSSVPPQIIDGRTMIPARPLAEALGATVTWDSINNAVIVTSVQTSVPPTSNNDIIKENGEDINMDEWIGIRDYSTQYKGSDEERFFSQVLFSNMSIMPKDEREIIIQTEKGPLTFISINSKTYVNISDMKLVGLLP